MIHPRRLKGTPANISRYFVVGDHGAKGVEEHSQWGGRIAAELGLDGKVDPAIFASLLAGKVAGQQLGRHGPDGTIQHHPGWDFAVNAPKTVSIIALVSGDERILAAHERAVGTALAYLEEHASLRHRSGGEIVHQTTGRLIFARFTEYASRELDPHLHTHVVVMNITNREDETQMASLESRAMFAEQTVAGQVYRNELAHELREMGYAVEVDPRSGLFEIRDVPAALIGEMSRRAEQIDDHAREHGLVGQAARRRSFYATRGAKEKVLLDDLHQRWAVRALPHIPALNAVRTAADLVGAKSLAPTAMTASRAMLFGIRQAETGEAVNNLGRMLKIGLASHVGEVRLADILPLAQQHQERAKLLTAPHQTGDEILTRGRTTRRTARLETALSEHLSLALGDGRALSSIDRIREVGAIAGLNAQQEVALLHIGTSVDRLVGVQGVAGAGKSTLVKSLVQASSQSMHFVALAPTSSAAAGLGKDAGLESRTVASLLASGGRPLTDADVLVVDEAGQLGNRQALRILEISRQTGARVILLGDNKQAGAIEQGKPFWLLQKLGLPTAELTESVRQETRQMKAAVTHARHGNFASSLANLDKVVTGEEAGALARLLVTEWTRLRPENRKTTNILVLENATRRIVNAEIRKVLKAEGAIAAEDIRLEVLWPSGMTDEEKRLARFYSAGQVVIFSQDNPSLGLARGAEYRVTGIGRAQNGRQLVRLVDVYGTEVSWDPRLGRASRLNVFKSEERDLAKGDRVQWRLVNRELGLKNAERGTVEALDGQCAMIRWDRGGRVQQVDLAKYKTWDHGYAETVYSAQSKTYARAYVLTPVNSALVTGQNYYTAITRARLGVKLWTEDEKLLIEKLTRRSGEKSSSIEGLGRLDHNWHRSRSERYPRRGDGLQALTLEQREKPTARPDSQTARGARPAADPLTRFADRVARRAQSTMERLDHFIDQMLSRSHGQHQSDLDGKGIGPDLWPNRTERDGGMHR